MSKVELLPIPEAKTSVSAHITFTLHGLDVDNKLVRAEVFARKLQIFLRGLAMADKHANGKRLHNFIIEDLKIGSAQVQVREKQSTKARPLHSSFDAYEEVAKAIYDGQVSSRKTPDDLVRTFTELSKGADKKFQHAEIKFSDSNIVRIDDYLLHQSERALQAIAHQDIKPSNIASFRGTSICTFDGVLKMIDSRGELLRATLVTTAGNKELDCIVRKDRIQDFADNFEHRVRIEGAAHYDSEQALPIRIDVKTIRPVKKDADLSKWRGAFRNGTALKEDW